MNDKYRFKRVEIRREISEACHELIADLSIAEDVYIRIMSPLEDFLSDHEVKEIDNCKCDFGKCHEQGDTLYESSDWDGGIGFDYIRDIKYCPLCGGLLDGEEQTEREDETMKMTPKEFAEKMQSIINKENTELGHIEMDNLMCELLKSLGYEEGIEIFNNALKWYS